MYYTEYIFCIWTYVRYIRLKKINAMSQSSWQIGRPDPNAVFFLLFFFLSSRRVRFESVTALKYGTWFLDEQDSRQNTELKKSVVQSVSLCLSYLFLFILTRKFIKNWKKKLSKQKNFKPWILLNQTRTEKQMRAAALRHMIYFFSLIDGKYYYTIC